MRFSELDGRRVGVWGAGLETRSFARSLAAHLPAARITTVVLDAPADAPELTEGARVVDEAGADEALAACDVLVRSPGVSIHKPQLRAAIKRGLPVATPIGLWIAEREGREMIGITATKGKSTTSALTAHLIGKTGREVRLVGNIGRPALELLDEPGEPLAVVELSSYQIADLAWGPQIALAGNALVDHLPWHGGDEQTYRREKLRLLNLPGVERCVVNATSPTVMAAPRRGTTLTFGDSGGWHVTPEGGVAHPDGRALAPADLPLLGDHNALNLCGALTALTAAEIELPALPAALADFEGLPHRLQEVHRAGGVHWIDDSIATNPAAATEAIRAFRKRHPAAQLVLIGGGLDRGQDYAALGELLAREGVWITAVPDTGERLLQAARAAGAPAERLHAAPDLEAAVAWARSVAAPGSFVLLSPGAASQNAFTDFKERGRRFQALAASA